MEQVVFILTLSIGSVAFGYVMKSILRAHLSHKEHIILGLSKELKLVTMFMLEPISMLSSFWSFSFNSTAVITLPLMGILMITLNAVFSLLTIKLTKLDPHKAASLFTAGVFSNIVTFGGLTAFMLFGVQGYSLILLVNLMISPLTYFIGYPMSHQISLGNPIRQTFTSRSYASKPYLAIPFAAFFLGAGLNLFKVPQPEFLPVLRSFLIPFTTTLLGFSIGITLRFGKIKTYTKEIGLIFLLKFVVSPVVIGLIAYVVGLREIMEGLPFKVAIIASVMPVAFNSLIPPALYGFDLDLANSAWITSTLAYAVVLPAVYLLVFV